MTDARARMAAFVHDLATLSEKHGVIIELSGDDPWFHIRPLSEGERAKYEIDPGKSWDDGASVAVGF